MNGLNCGKDADPKVFHQPSLAFCMWHESVYRGETLGWNQALDPDWPRSNLLHLLTACSYLRSLDSFNLFPHLQMGIHSTTQTRWLERARASSCCRVRDKSSTQKVDAGVMKNSLHIPFEEGGWYTLGLVSYSVKVITWSLWDLEGPCV